MQSKKKQARNLKKGQKSKNLSFLKVIFSIILLKSIRLLRDEEKILKKVNSNSTHPEPKFNLLPDIPLDSDNEKDIQFGHLQISNTLAQLIINAVPPFTIGLFGKWGTGKSTIAANLKKKLEEKNIITVNFDVWKYEDDSLRRQFLIKLDEELGLKLDYRNVLNQSLTKPIGIGFIKNLTETLKYLSLSAIIFGSIILIYILLRSQFNLTELLSSSNIINQNLISNLFNFSLFVVILGFVQNAIKINYGSVQTTKTDSAEGFEARFFEVLEKIKDEKILVIIDNLDRSRADKAISLLSDIKTFLAKDSDVRNKVKGKAIFLIACDDFAIKEQLIECKFDNPDEFLRKFFNASLRIPMFLDVDLDIYTTELIKTTGVSKFQNNDRLVWLITYAFRGNPREIKQFLNSLIAEYLLAVNATKSKQISSKDVVDNVEFLAKIQIIKLKFPTVYNAIEEAAIRFAAEWKDIEAEARQTPSIDLRETFNSVDKQEWKQFKEFTEDTSDINPGYLPFFISLRQSSDEQKLNNWRVFLVAAIDKKLDIAQEIFNKIKSNNQLSQLDELSYDFLRSEHRKFRYRKSEKLTSFGSSLILVSQKSITSLRLFLPDFIKRFPRQHDLITDIKDFPVDLYFDIVYPLLNEKNKKNLVGHFIDILNIGDGSNPQKHLLDKEEARLIYNQIITHQEYFDPALNDKIKKSLETSFCIPDILEMFIPLELKDKYISQTTINNLINSIVVDDLNDPNTLEKKLDVLNKMYV